MRLAGKRVLVTQAADYMGPAIGRLFRAEGAEVIDDTSDPRLPESCSSMLERAGSIDVLIANLAHPPCASGVSEIRDADWSSLFDSLVHPLMRVVRGAAATMRAQGQGKIVAVTSAAPLRGIAGASAYCAARGAQNAFIRAVGLELAAYNVQVNAIAQNYVHNTSYYPPELVATERFQKHLARNVPAQRLGRGEETAELALFLASQNSDFLVGQIIPFAGGWAV